jgi:RimJ/RimL family protein N-acetyltransferase
MEAERSGHALSRDVSATDTPVHTGRPLVERIHASMACVYSLDHRIGWELGTFNCPLILRATDQLIGNVGLNPFLKDERIPEIEWQIGPEHWGKGYATEIGRAMLSYGFQEAGFPAIMGFALSHHAPSRRVMEKIGMTYLYDKEVDGQTKSFYRIERHDFVI